MTTAGTLMGVKKSEAGAGPKLGVVKVDRDLITKAKLIAADRGIPMGSYLSDAMRINVERDWGKIIRKAGEGSAK